MTPSSTVAAADTTPELDLAPYTTPIVDERAQVSDPLPHEQVRGHFEGTDVEFTIHLPPSSAWEGRFYQYTYPMPIPGVNLGGRATDRAIRFALDHGGYAVQAGSSERTVLGHRHAAAAAEFAREIAAEHYGAQGRHIPGYLYGPSGGSFQTVGALELSGGVWDGYVPMVLGTPVSIPSTFFIRAMGRLVLSDVAPRIAGALAPGGSGDPFAGLDAAETAMLEELHAFGIPWSAWEDPDYLLGIVDLDGEPLADGLLGFGEVVRQIDPGYAEDFWTEDGYLGTEQSPLGDRVRARLAEIGDSEENRWLVALPSYYRHQLPGPDEGYIGFDRFRRADGTPHHPQRHVEIGPLMQKETTGGATYSGEVSGKVIIFDTLGDSDALPWHADWYADRIRARLGDRADDKLRVYFHESSDHHEQPVTGRRATHLVSYMGAVEQALVDLTLWVEDGVPAPESTRYRVEDAQIVVPRRAHERGGIQPTASLSARPTADGAGCELHLTADAPKGVLTHVAWDFEGSGRFEEIELDHPARHLELTRRVPLGDVQDAVVGVRVTSRRTDGVCSEHCRVLNLARAKVTGGVDDPAPTTTTRTVTR